MLGPPGQRPRRVQSRNAGQRLGQPVPIRLADAQVVAAIRRQLVGLVEDHQVVRHDGRFPEAGEHLGASQRVDADDDLIAVFADERVRVLGVGAADNAELQVEQRPQLALPVADQPRGRDDQDPPDQPAGHPFPDVQARHDRLAGPGVVRQQEPQRRLLQHVLVDGDPLVRQRVDLRDFRGERRVEHVAERQPFAFDNRPDHVRRPREVRDRHDRRLPGILGRRRRIPLVDLKNLGPSQRRRLRLPILPTVYRSERHPQSCRQLDLRQPQPPTKLPDPMRIIGRQTGSRRDVGRHCRSRPSGMVEATAKLRRVYQVL